MAILLLPMLSIAAPVRASTGQPLLGAIDASDNTWVSATNVSIKAGELYVAAVDNADLVGLEYMFAIIFSWNGTDYVTFSGAQFDLYMSKDGYSSLSAGDKLYASGFSVSALSLPYPQATNKTNALLKDDPTTFNLGTKTVFDMNSSTYVTAKVLTGPVPFDITSDYTYVKVFDGSGTLLAVSRQNINILPSFTLSPTSGPAGTTVTLTGTALAANTYYNITYSNDSLAAAQVLSSEEGKVSFSWPIVDLCNDWNDIESETVYIDIWNNATATFVDEMTFEEMSRMFIAVETVYDTDGPYGNITYGEGTYISVDVDVFGDIDIEGNYWNPQSSVVITVDGITLGTETTNATGYFATTVVCPILTLGAHNVTVSNGGCSYLFEIVVQPTLIVTPDNGPIGTVVTFTAYGFPENTEFFLYWFELCFDEGIYYNIANATTGEDGTFNTTVTFTVPAQYGGPHYIFASYSFQNATVEGYYEEGGEIWYGLENITAYTTFAVTPTMYITPNSFANDDGFFWVNVTGAFVFDWRSTTTDHYLPVYDIMVDNQETSIGSPGHVSADACGNFALKLSTAGFRPGLHVVSMYFYCQEIDYDLETGYPMGYEFLEQYWLPGFIAPITTATFTVSIEGDPVIAQILSLNGTFATVLDAKLGPVITSINDIGLKVTSIQGTVATIQTNLGTLTGTVTAMNGDIATIKTDLGTVKTNVAAVKGFLPVDMTPVWIAVILSLIAAIAAIYSIIVIRSKIAA